MLGVLLSFCIAPIEGVLHDNSSQSQPVSGADYWFVTFPFLLLEEHYVHNGNIFGGKVVALTEDTITVKKWTGIPRTFNVAPPLTSKRIPLEWHVGCGHRLNDVRIGDKAGFHLVSTPRGYTVVALGIYRRPGGTIPPAEDEHIPERSRMHHYYNACQAVEEKVLPKLPRKFLHFHP